MVVAADGDAAVVAVVAAVVVAAVVVAAAVASMHAICYSSCCQLGLTVMVMHSA